MSNDSQHSPAYERLREAIEELVVSGEFGEPLGHVVGWVVVINQQEVGNRQEDLTMVFAPWQSQAMSRGIIWWACDELPIRYMELEDNDEGEND